MKRLGVLVAAFTAVAISVNAGEFLLPVSCKEVNGKFDGWEGQRITDFLLGAREGIVLGIEDLGTPGAEGGTFAIGIRLTSVEELISWMARQCESSPWHSAPLDHALREVIREHRVEIISRAERALENFEKSLKTPEGKSLQDALDALPSQVDP